MRIMRRVLIALFFSMIAVPGFAQTCAGGPSFGYAPFQVRGALAFSDSTKQVAGGFGGGNARAFGGVEIGHVSYNNVDASATTVAGFGGAEYQADSSGRVFFCPLGRVSYVSGPNVGPVDSHTLVIAGGGQLGVVVASTGGAEFIPTVGMTYDHSRTKASNAVDAVSQDYGIVTVGLGIVFNRTFAVVPAFDVPVALDGGQTDFSLNFVFNFGR
jgi:hypothetical protein